MKILQVNIDNKGAGGAYVLIHNIQKVLEKKNPTIKFDFLTMDKFDSNRDNFPTSDSRLFELNLRKNRLLGHLKLPFIIYKIFKNNPYDVVHIHSDSAWKICLYYFPARIAKVKNIIFHAHSTGLDGDCKIIKIISHHIGHYLLKNAQGTAIACSSDAAKFVFGTKFLRSHKYLILKNGIEVSKFKFSQKKREKFRKKYGLENAFIVGNTSKVCFAKNPEFLVEVFYELKKINRNVKLLFIGNVDKEYYKIIEKLISKKKLNNDILFLGFTNNVSEILSALDYFVFPSRFEGLGISLIEAQANGLPCIVSEGIPDLAVTSKKTIKLSVSSGAKKWAEVILRDHERNKFGINEVQQNGFDILDTAKVLEEIYKKYEA
ncbi:glycosyltransferase [Streptococcus equinus]|uniref:glycosyltransferase n=1 Tax=Streptococcus equinus TaxID=1335 RepID=UPI003BF88AD9